MSQFIKEYYTESGKQNLTEVKRPKISDKDKKKSKKEKQDGQSHTA